MTTNPTPTPPALPPAKRKRGRWWKILLAFVLLLFLLVLLAPTLLSTAAGKEFILSEVNKYAPGKITAEAISLGWFSGAKVSKVEMVDPLGKKMISVDNVDTGVTLWDGVSGSTIDLSKFNITGGKMPQVPGTTVSIHLVGLADLGKKIVSITADSTVSAVDDKSGKGTILTIASGSKFSWAGDPSDATLTLAYDWQQLQSLVQSSLPEGTVMAGQRTAKFHVTGAMAKDGAGLRALRGLKLDPTSLGFDRMATKGIELGKADIPFQMTGGILTITPTTIPANNGTLEVVGKVDFNADPPAYILEKNPAGYPLVKGLNLNHDVAAGPLNFLPLMWGDKTGNLAEMTGQANVQMMEAYIPLDSAAYKTKGTIDGTISVTNITTELPFLSGAFKDLGPLMKVGPADLFAIRGGKIPDVHFALANGKVSYQNLMLGTPQVNISFSGSVGLDTSLAMSAQVTALVTSIPIPIGLKGTTAKPELTIDKDALGKINPADLGKALQKDAPQILDQFLNKKKK